MKIDTYTTMMGLAVIFSIVYLLSNFILQYRIEKALENIIKNNKDVIKKEYYKQMNSILKKDKESNFEILLLILREQIEHLNDNFKRGVIEKTLDRKNYTNQKQYANRIFSESGLTELTKKVA